MELGDELPTENRYPDDSIDQSDDNFGDQPPFPIENDDHPPSSSPSEPEVPDIPDRDIEHNTLHILREICPFLCLNGMIRTLQGVVRDSKQYKVILTASMAIEHWLIFNEMTYAGELAISRVAPMLHLNSRHRILFPDLVMHRLLYI